MNHFTIDELPDETRGIVVVWPDNTVSFVRRGPNTWVFMGRGSVVFDESSLDGNAGTAGTIEIAQDELVERRDREEHSPDSPWFRIAARMTTSYDGLTTYKVEMEPELQCMVLPRWAYNVLTKDGCEPLRLYETAKLCVDFLQSLELSKYEFRKKLPGIKASIAMLIPIGKFQSLHQAQLTRLAEESSTT